MSAPSQILVVILALLLAGCEMRLGHAKTPATPQPTAAKIDPAPEPQSSEPLSIPQTQVELPRPQAIDPQALATPPVYTPAETASQHPAHRPPKRQVVGQPNAPMTKPEQADQPPPEPVPAQVAEAPSRPKIEPILPAQERRQLQEDIASRLREVDQLIGEITRRRSTESQRSSLARIRSFANLSHQALERGETQQASALADRALLLAQETLRAR